MQSSGFRKTLQIIALILWGIIIVFVLINRDKFSADEIISYTPDNLWLAAAMMMVLFALKTLSVVFYSGLLFTVSGMIFPLPIAITVNVFGSVVMLLEGYVIGKLSGHKLIEELSSKFPRFSDFTGLKDKHPFVFSLLIRMLKIVNYDIGSMYMGASGVSLFPYLLGSLTALAPEMVLFAVAGNGISNMDAVPAIAAAAAYVVMTLASILGLRHLMKLSGQK